MKLPVGMNLSPRWVGILAERGIKGAHWSAMGPANASDPEIMGCAGTHGYVVLTHDLDVRAIFATTGGGKPSVVQIRAEDVGIAAIGVQVVAALWQMAAELEAGALLTVEPGRMRVRHLPLHRS